MASSKFKFALGLVGLVLILGLVENSGLARPSVTLNAVADESLRFTMSLAKEVAVLFRGLLVFVRVLGEAINVLTVPLQKSIQAVGGWAMTLVMWSTDWSCQWAVPFARLAVIPLTFAFTVVAESVDTPQDLALLFFLFHVFMMAIIVILWLRERHGVTLRPAKLGKSQNLARLLAKRHVDPSLRPIDA